MSDDSPELDPARPGAPRPGGAVRSRSSAGGKVERHGGRMKGTQRIVEVTGSMAAPAGATVTVRAREGAMRSGKIRGFVEAAVRRGAKAETQAAPKLAAAPAPATLAEVLARLDALPQGFTDQYRDPEPWPGDLPEVMGGDLSGPFKGPPRRGRTP